jgi:hypothetical protein
VWSLVLGGLSLLLVLHWAFVVLPITAVYLGRRAMKQIARSPDEYTGEGLAWGGIGLALLFFLVGSGCLIWIRGRDVPHGYQYVEYAELQPDLNVEGQKVPPGAMDLDGKRVFIKGYMVPGRQQVGLKHFLLCPTNGVCTFHFPNPKPTEIIDIKLREDLATAYTTQLVGLGGVFHVDPDDPHGKPYSMDADYFSWF